MVYAKLLDGRIQQQMKLTEILYSYSLIPFFYDLDQVEISHNQDPLVKFTKIANALYPTFNLFKNNACCDPNLYQLATNNDRTMIMWTIKPIKAGEELTVLRRQNAVLKHCSPKLRAVVKK